VIGRLQKTVVECPDPRALADFYCALLDMEVVKELDGWVVIGRGGTRELAFQRPERWVPPPLWPDPLGAPRLHLDVRVDDIEAAQVSVLALGATRAPGAPETGYRVFLDPVGHPFCLVHGPDSAHDPRWPG
jgi:catechol 2,3-dioxygenase-like lactoylglutathione lyase family enzyme